MPSQTRYSKPKTPYAKLILLAALLLAGASACRADPPSPTFLAPVEITSPTPPPTRQPSATPRPIRTPTPHPSPSATITPTRTPGPTATLRDAPPPETIAPALLTQVAAPVRTATLPADVTLVGRSVEGRGIVARRLGNGSQTLLLVGGIHGGWEVNTVALMNQVIAHFAESPEEVAPGLALVVIPALNPDGLVRGRQPEGRFNARGVDLNRNWGCDWSPEAFWQDRPVDAGAQPFSEPESAALADYILFNPPAAVLFYHSAANGVFAGACDGDHGSQALADRYGTAAHYPSGAAFSAYEVTGDASSWVDGQGIPAAVVELQSWTETEWERNYAGIMAVQCDLARRRIDPGAQAWVAARCAAPAS